MGAVVATARLAIAGHRWPPKEEAVRTVHSIGVAWLELTAAGLVAGPVVCVAHRGRIVSDQPEIRLVAFRRAMEVGADETQIDLRGTKDDAGSDP